MMDWMSSVSTDIIEEFIMEIVIVIVIIIVAMIMSAISLILKFLFGDTFIKIKFKDLDAVSLSTAGILNLEFTKQILINQFFEFKKCICNIDKEKMESIAEGKLVDLYSRYLKKFNDYCQELIFQDPEVIHCSIYDLKHIKDDVFISVAVII